MQTEMFMTDLGRMTKRMASVFIATLTAQGTKASGRKTSSTAMVLRPGPTEQATKGSMLKDASMDRAASLGLITAPTPATLSKTISKELVSYSRLGTEL